MPDSTINGLSALTGANVDQTADQLPIWQNSASTTRKITRTELFNGPIPGALGSAVRAAANEMVGAWFDGATSDSRITSNLTGQNIGTGDFSIWARFRVPSTVNSINRSIVGISTSATTPLQAESIHLFLAGNAGELAVRLYGATTSDLRQATINSFLSTFTGQVVDIVVTRTGATLKIYVNGVDTSYTESTAGGSPPAWSAAVTSTICNVGAGFGGALCNTRVYRVAVFNRTLSAADAIEVGTTGINPADQWGSQLAQYTSNFTAGADSFSSVIGGVVTATGNETAPDASTGWLKCVRNNAGVGRSDVQRIGTTTGFIKRFRAAAQIYNVDCGTQWWGLQGDNATDIKDSSAQVANNTSATVSQEYTSTNSNYFRIGPAPSSTGLVSAGGVPSGSTWYVKNITIIRIGAFVDLDLTIGSGSVATDRSSNNLSGAFFGTGVSWSPTSNAQDISSATKAACSDYAAAMFDGNTANTRIAAPCQAIGTGDFSLWSRFRVPTSLASGTGPGIIGLSDSNNTAQRPYGTNVSLSASTGALDVIRYGAATSDYRLARVAAVQQSFNGQIVDLVVTRTGNTLKIYINGVDVVYSESTAGTPPAWGDTITSSFVFVGAANTSATTIFPGRIYRAVVFNRLLTKSDVVELTNFGVNPADQWGTQTAIISGATGNGDFENWTTPGTAGTSNGTLTGWVATQAASGGTSVTRNSTSPISGTYDCLLTNGGTVQCGIRTNTAPVVVSKRYSASWTALRLTGTVNLIFGNSVTNTAIKTTTLVTGSSVSDYAEFVSDSTNLQLVLSGLSAATVQVDNVVVTRIGAIVDLDFTVGAGYQATDRSTNNLHGTLFNGVEFSMPKRVAVVYATTNTSGNQQMLGTLAIPTNAIIEDIIVNSSGSATVSIGNASAGTQIVNGASVVSGRQKLTLAIPFSTTGNLWVNSSSTATLQFTILYTIAS